MVREEVKSFADIIRNKDEGKIRDMRIHQRGGSKINSSNILIRPQTLTKLTEDLKKENQRLKEEMEKLKSYQPPKVGSLESHSEDSLSVLSEHEYGEIHQTHGYVIRNNEKMMLEKNEVIFRNHLEKMSNQMNLVSAGIVASQFKEKQEGEELARRYMELLEHSKGLEEQNSKLLALVGTLEEKNKLYIQDQIAKEGEGGASQNLEIFDEMKKYQEFERIISKSQGEIAEKTAMIERLHEQNSHLKYLLEEERGNWAVNYERLEKSCKEIVRDFDELNQDYQSAISKISFLTEENKVMGSNNKELRKQNEWLKNQENILKDQVVSMRNEIDILAQAAINPKEKEKYLKLRDYKSLQKEKVTVEAMQLKEEQIEGMKSHIVMLEQKLRLHSESHLNLELLSEEILSLKRQIKDLTSAKELLETTLHHSEEKNKEVDHHNSVLQGQLAELKKERDYLTSQKETLEREVSESQNEIHELRDSDAQLRTTIDRLEAALVETSRKIEETSKENQKLHGENQKQKESIDEKSRKISDLESEKAELGSLLKKTEEHALEEQNKMAGRLEEAAKREKELLEKIEMISNELKNKEEENNGVKESVVSQLKENEGVFMSKFQRKKEKKGELRLRLEQFEREKEELLEARGKLGGLSSNLETSKVEYQQLLEVLEQKKEALSEMLAKNEEASKRISELEEERSKMDKRIKALERNFSLLEESHGEKLKTLGTEAHKKEEERKNLKKEMEELEERAIKLKAKKSFLKERVQILENEFKSSNNFIESIRQMRVDAETKHKEEVDRLTEKGTSLMSQLQEKSTELNQKKQIEREMRSQLKEAQEEIEILKTEKELRDKQIETLKIDLQKQMFLLRSYAASPSSALPREVAIAVYGKSQGQEAYGKPQAFEKLGEMPKSERERSSPMKQENKSLQGTPVKAENNQRFQNSRVMGSNRIRASMVPGSSGSKLNERTLPIREKFGGVPSNENEKTIAYKSKILPGLLSGGVVMVYSSKPFFTSQLSEESAENFKGLVLRREGTLMVLKDLKIEVKFSPFSSPSFSKNLVQVELKALNISETQLVEFQANYNGNSTLKVKVKPKTVPSELQPKSFFQQSIIAGFEELPYLILEYEVAYK